MLDPNTRARRETFDPTKMTNSTDIMRAYQVYNRLTNLDREMNVVPNLATEWEATNQAAEWTFKLREGVEFHDGKTLTSADVIYSLSEHIKEGSQSPSKPLLKPIVDMRADGPNVVKITLNSGNADFPVTLGHDYHTSIVAEGWKDGDPVVGSGPYKLAEFTPGLASVTEKNGNLLESGRRACLDIHHPGHSRQCGAFQRPSVRWYRHRCVCRTSSRQLAGTEQRRQGSLHAIRFLVRLDHGG